MQTGESEELENNTGNTCNTTDTEPMKGRLEELC